MGGWDGSGSNASNRELWGAADEALLARPLLTSCCVARFLTGHGLVPVCGPGVGDPCSSVYMYHIFFICSSVDGQLGCFHALAIVNIAAMNIGVHVSF